MGGIGATWRVLRSISAISWSFLLALMIASAERSLKQQEANYSPSQASRSDYFAPFVNFLWQSGQSGYQHVWPEMQFGWRLVLGTIIGFFGAAFGSVGGVGGGGIFVPMLSLIIGFDAKSATAISKCMIMGGAGSTVYYNLKLRHPTLDMPIIDYDLALLVQPMLMMGISIGVAFNVILADWMITILLIILFVGTRQEGAEYKLLPGGPSNDTKNVITDFAEPEIPVSFGVTLYEAISLYKGSKVIASKGHAATDMKVHQLVLYCSCGILAGIVGGLLGLGGGFILGPLFLELGVPPQVSSATATFAMTFSSSMSVIEYYLLKRFPVPYGNFLHLLAALYFVAVATVAALAGQSVVRRLIILLGRASLIIFILSLTIFISAISLGGVGIVKMIEKLEKHEYMGLENLCTYET
ncbi:sulfite exporter TauE/SafE family protein [Actinidia rufa]|uniref:Sulfite exporter TauE/SafE family protein n=1 Tax=Actinidia rufa TaxID=165716 RepID=A0A7J0DHM7_9ERIC|nr:sulfite exporter TauE/SafE family protein [Actinidia rufa]